MCKEEKYQVYKITNKVNGLIYIGGTSSGIQKRFDLHKDRAVKGYSSPLYRAIREYGADQFEISVVEDCNSQDELNRQERYWIATLGSTNPEIGYNVKLGGDIFRHTPTTKLRMSAIRKGVESKNRIPILQYDYTGEFVAEYPSLTEAANQLGCFRSKIIRSLQGNVVRPTKSNPYIFIYKEIDKPVSLHINPDDYYKDMSYKNELSNNFLEVRHDYLVKDGDMTKLATPVEQYDWDGNLISKFYSLAEASRQTKVSVAAIKRQINDPDYIKTLKNTSRTKYIWKKADINDPDIKITKEQMTLENAKKHSRLIQALDDSGNVVKQYKNIKEFEAAEHCDRRTMMASIVRDVPFKGYYWKIIQN